MIVRERLDVKLLKKVLVYHALYHVIGRNNYIIACAAVFDFGIHILIAFKGDVIDLDAGQLFKLLVNVEHSVLIAVADIFAPVEYVQNLALFCALIVFLMLISGAVQNAGANNKRADKGKNNLFHYSCTSLSSLFLSFLSPCICERLRATSRKRIVAKMRVESAYISGVTRFFVIEKMRIGSVSKDGP